MSEEQKDWTCRISYPTHPFTNGYRSSAPRSTGEKGEGLLVLLCRTVLAGRAAAPPSIRRPSCRPPPVRRAGVEPVAGVSVLARLEELSQGPRSLISWLVGQAA